MTSQPDVDNALQPEESTEGVGQETETEEIDLQDETAGPEVSDAELEAARLKPIYFVSGLGADERIFQWLHYDGFRPVHIRWIPPQKGESIESYAKRLSEQIVDEQPTIVGLSFGGMIAVELAKQVNAEKVILLSTVKKTSEVPFYFKMFRAFPIHRVFPFKSVLWAFYWLANWLFSPEGSEEKTLLKTVLKETDPHFLKWALHKVVVWKNREIPESVVHVHGKRDRIFPFRLVAPDYAVEDCGHLMVMNRAEEISTLIMKLTADQ